MGVGRIPAIEAARGIAALMVVATHVQYFHRLDDASLPSWLGFMSNGGVGVNLFFVLSGLVLYLPYARGKRLDLAEYTAARLLRIVPAAWVALAVSGIVVGIWSWAAVRQMLFVNPWAQQGVSPDPPAWSLTIEIGFYVLLPILAAVFVKRSAYRVPILLSLVVFGTLARHEMTSGGWPKMPLTYVDNFACGMLAAIIVARVGRLPSWTLLIGAVTFVMALGSVGEGAIWVTLAGALFAVSLATLASVNPRTAPPLVWLGTVSYGIYLWHWPVLEVATDHGLYGLPDPVEMAAVAGLAILLGWLSWRIVERPALAQRHNIVQWLRRQRGPSDVASEVGA